MTPLINAREVSVGHRSVKHKGNNTTSGSGSLLRLIWGPASEETTILTQEEIFSNQETQKQSCVSVNGPEETGLIPPSVNLQMFCSCINTAWCYTDVTRMTTSPESLSWLRLFWGNRPGQKGAKQRQVHGCGPSWVGCNGPLGPKVTRGNQSVLGPSEEWPVLDSSMSFALS